MHCVSLFFLNERDITTSLLMIPLKCNVVHYDNLNLSSINKLFFNCGPMNVLFCWGFFSISYLRLFQRGFFQQVYEKIIIFQYKFPKLISKCSALQNIKMSNLVILKWWRFEYKTKFEKKKLFYLGKKQTFLTYNLIDYTKEILKIYKSIVIEISNPWHYVL